MQLAEQLPAQGFASLIVAFLQGGDLEKDCQARKIPYLVMQRSGWFKRWKNFWALRRLLADLRPAMVHTHLFGSDFWGRWAARWAGIREIVTTEHNVSPDLGFLRTSILRCMKSCSTAYVAISSSVENYLTEKIGIPKDKVRLIYNGLDLKRIIARPASSWHDIPHLIFVGRLEPQKNPELVLRSLAPIRRPWRLTLVGIGSREAELKALAQDLKISSRVDFMGRRQDVPKLLAQSDIFLFPSRWEGFGLALAEAAAAGVPVIASDLPVLREMLSDDEATFVPAADVSAWTQAIQAALADPAPYVAKAQHAAAADWSRFSEERMIAQYAELYRRLIMKNVKRIT
jgi:glycosyltransferase involved in cell wall biosynthesis